MMHSRNDTSNDNNFIFKKKAELISALVEYAKAEQILKNVDEKFQKFTNNCANVERASCREYIPKQIFKSHDFGDRKRIKCLVDGSMTRIKHEIEKELAENNRLKKKITSTNMFKSENIKMPIPKENLRIWKTRNSSSSSSLKPKVSSTFLEQKISSKNDFSNIYKKPKLKIFQKKNYGINESSSIVSEVHVPVQVIPSGSKSLLRKSAFSQPINPPVIKYHQLRNELTFANYPNSRQLSNQPCSITDQISNENHASNFVTFPTETQPPVHCQSPSNRQLVKGVNGKLIPLMLPKQWPPQMLPSLNQPVSSKVFNSPSSHVISQKFTSKPFKNTEKYFTSAKVSSKYHKSQQTISPPVVCKTVNTNDFEIQGDRGEVEDDIKMTQKDVGLSEKAGPLIEADDGADIIENVNNQVNGDSKKFDNDVEVVDDDDDNADYTDKLVGDDTRGVRVASNEIVDDKKAVDAAENDNDEEAGDDKVDNNDKKAGDDKVDNNDKESGDDKVDENDEEDDDNVDTDDKVKADDKIDGNDKLADGNKVIDGVKLAGGNDKEDDDKLDGDKVAGGDGKEDDDKTDDSVVRSDFRSQEDVLRSTNQLMDLFKDTLRHKLEEFMTSERKATNTEGVEKHVGGDNKNNNYHDQENDRKEALRYIDKEANASKSNNADKTEEVVNVDDNEKNIKVTRPSKREMRPKIKKKDEHNSSNEEGTTSSEASSGNKSSSLESTKSEKRCFCSNSKGKKLASSSSSRASMRKKNPLQCNFYSESSMTEQDESLTEGAEESRKKQEGNVDVYNGDCDGESLNDACSTISESLSEGQWLFSDVDVAAQCSGDKGLEDEDENGDHGVVEEGEVLWAEANWTCPGTEGKHELPKKANDDAATVSAASSEGELVFVGQSQNDKPTEKTELK